MKKDNPKITILRGDLPPIETDLKTMKQASALIGHNSGKRKKEGSSRCPSKDAGGIAGVRLLAFIERVERLEEEKAALLEDIKEIYAEAKGVGFDTKTMCKIVRLRAMDSETRRENAEMLKLYAAAVGLQHILEV